MGILKLYENGVEMNLAAGIINTDDLDAVTSGTIGSWTANVSSSNNFLTVRIVRTGSMPPAVDEIENLMNEVFNLRCSGIIAADIRNTVDFGFTRYITKNIDGGYPRYQISYTTSGSSKRSAVAWYRTSNRYCTTYSDDETSASMIKDGMICPIIVTTNLLDGYIGALSVNRVININFPNSSGYTVEIVVDKNTYYNSISDLTPGSKNFRPTADRTSKFTPGTGGRPPGGNKRPTYSGDPIAQPGAPNETSASMVGVGMLTAYQIDKANLENVAKCLYSETFLTALANLLINPIDGIVSLNIFPCAPDVNASTAIKLLNHACTVGDLGISATGSPLSKQFKVFDFGTVKIDENWGSFLDYSDTEIELYLPFIGSVQLDTSECMNGSVNVQYTVDFITGMCVANVLCTRKVLLPTGAYGTGNSQHAYQGNCAVQIPLTAVNYSNLVGSLIGSCTAALANPAAGIATFTEKAVSGGLKPSVTTKGSIVANAGFCSILYPYVRIRRPITAEPDSYQTVMGLPSYINTTLAECEDYCVCDGIDLQSITGATDSELERIRQACMSGIHV